MRKIGGFLIQTMRRVKIFYRLLVTFLLATLLPIIFFSIWSYNKNSQVIREKVFVSVDAMLNRVSGELNQKIVKIRNDSIEISYMAEIQDVLANYENYNNRQLNLVNINVTRAMSKKYVFDNIVSSIVLYTPKLDKIVAYGSYGDYMNLKEDYLKEFLETCRKQDGKCVFRAVNRGDEKETSGQGREHAIAVGKAVKQSSTGNIVGYMLMEIEENKFSDIYKDVSSSMEACTFIMDERGEVVSTAGEYAQVGEPYSQQNIRELVPSGEEKGEEYIHVTEDGISRTVLTRRMEENDWQLFLMLPEEYLQAGLSTALGSFAGISLGCILLGILVTFTFSASIVRPLDKVMEGIEQFQTGNLSVVLDETGDDEITRLAEHFNRMSKEISSLMEQEKNSEKQKRKLEIQALQAQINPHFLANTLNTVSYIAKLRREETIENLINAIIELLRDSMKNDDSLHLVEEEVALIKSYITIQDYRLLGKFSVDMKVEQDILPLLMPRFILQPVLENAIIHGIEPLNRRGVISLKGYRQGEELVFLITDNGTGMEKDKIQEILQERRNVERLRFSGMGIGNVDKRIKLLMGKEYGVTIKSEKNIFTSVMIRLPVMEKEEG